MTKVIYLFLMSILFIFNMKINAQDSKGINWVDLQKRADELARPEKQQYWKGELEKLGFPAFQASEFHSLKNLSDKVWITQVYTNQNNWAMVKILLQTFDEDVILSNPVLMISLTNLLGAIGANLPANQELLKIWQKTEKFKINESRYLLNTYAIFLDLKDLIHAMKALDHLYDGEEKTIKKGELLLKAKLHKWKNLPLYDSIIPKLKQLINPDSKYLPKSVFLYYSLSPTSLIDADFEDNIKLLIQSKYTILEHEAMELIQLIIQNNKSPLTKDIMLFWLSKTINDDTNISNIILRIAFDNELFNWHEITRNENFNVLFKDKILNQNLPDEVKLALMLYWDPIWEPISKWSLGKKHFSLEKGAHSPALIFRNKKFNSSRLKYTGEPISKLGFLFFTIKNERKNEPISILVRLNNQTKFVTKFDQTNWDLIRIPLAPQKGQAINHIELIFKNESNQNTMFKITAPELLIIEEDQL